MENSMVNPPREGGGDSNTTSNTLRLQVKHAFGCQPTRLDAIQSFSASSGNKDYSDRLVHKIGKQLCVYDPETGRQEFFEGRARNLVDIVHFNISTNARYISMCENIRHEKASNDAGSQVSIYSLSTMSRLKTLHYSLPRPFLCSTFCGDVKLVAALSDEPDRHIVIWQWEKEKVYKVIAITVSALLLRSAPCQTLMLTTTGHAALKHWTIAPDGSLKCGNFLPPAKESLDNYTDHVWQVSSLGNHRMIVLVDPDTNSEINRNRRQSIYIFEGMDPAHAGASSTNAMGISSSSSSGLPISMELKQTLALKLDPGCRIEKIICSPKTLMVVGYGGFIAAYERTDDKQEPYVESRRLSLGDKHLIGGAIYPSDEKMVLLTKQGRLLTMQLDVTIDQIKKTVAMLGNSAGGEDVDSVHSQDGGGSINNSSAAGTNASNSYNSSSGISDMRSGGHHTAAILAADIAFERPLIVSVAADATARIWNYLTGKCEVVHSFRMEEPITVAFHPSGYQILVSFKDRIRSYHVLIDKIKPFRETIVKNAKCLKYSNGGQYWAAASAINVSVYETRTFTQLVNYQGHQLTVVRLCWAPGDEVLFSAGMDGNVYGWPVSREGRMEVVAANTRSSAILDMVADCPSTVFLASTKDQDDDVSTVGNPSGNVGQSTGNNNINSLSTNKAQSNAVVNTKNEDAQALTQFQQAVLPDNRSWLVISSLDGHLRMPVWSLQAVAKQQPHHPGHGPSAATVSILASSQNALSKYYTNIDSMSIMYGDSSISMTAMALSADRTKLFVGTSMGSIRIYPWPPDPNNMPAYVPTGATGSHATGHEKGRASQHGGTGGGEGDREHGSNHLPPTVTHASLCVEYFTHSAAVVSIALGPVENTLISTAADGSIFIHNYTNQPITNANKKTRGSSPNNQAGALYSMEFENTEEGIQLNREVVLLAVEDIEDHINDIVDLHKLLNETRAKNEFQARKLEVEHNEALRRVTEVHDQTLNKEKDNFEKQRTTFDKRIRELMATIESKESDHIKVLTELENKYEHKLADQLERYDLLSEKMQLLKQKCEGLLEAEKINFDKQMTELKGRFNSEEKRYKLENKRAVEDKIANESALKEIINQQEDEYEDELRQLIQAAESELVSERETILKLRTLVQTKNTKLDQLKKKLIELQSASKARLALLNQEKTEKQNLLAIIEHYKKNLIEREDALAEKEKLVLELRSKTRTLENFRFVLDHRLQQLSSERGPITSHIEGLEKHISTMYEELVEEFSNKKAATEASVLKDQKITWISQDLNKMRQNVREKEQTIAAFKRDLGNIISSMVVGKELEESVKMLYKKFVRGEITGVSGKNSTVKLNSRVAEAVSELMHSGMQGSLNHGSGGKYIDVDDQSFLSTDSLVNQNKHIGTGGVAHLPTLTAGAGHLIAAGQAGAAISGGPNRTLAKDVEEALVETAKEAERQKKFVERQASNLKHRLQATQKEAHVLIRHRLHENSDLLFENNDLRTENKELHRKLNIHKQQIEQLERTIKALKNAPLNSSGPLPFYMQGSQNIAAEGAAPAAVSADSFQSVPSDIAAAVNRAVNQNDQDVAPWVVHNSLPPPSPNGEIGALLLPNRRPDDADSIHTLTGKPISPAIVGSQSMPILNANGDIDPSSLALNVLQKHLNNTLSNISGKPQKSASSSVLQGSGINVVRSLQSLQGVESKGRGSKSAGKERISLALPQTNKQIEKLTKEMESLAEQLDNTYREKELYRLEVTKLQRQMQQLSQQSLSHASGGSVGQQSRTDGIADGSIENNASATLPNRSQGSVVFVEGNDFDEDSNVLHADLYGYPSEEDRQIMRIDGLQSVPSSSSAAYRPTGSTSSQRSRSRSTKSRPSNPLNDSGDANDGIINSIDQEQFSLQST
eukprot:gene2482-2720_t